MDDEAWTLLALLLDAWWRLDQLRAIALESLGEDVVESP